MKRALLIFCAGLIGLLMSANKIEDNQERQAMEVDSLKSKVKAVEAANRALNDSLMRINGRMKANADSLNSLRTHLNILNAALKENSSRLNDEIGATNSNLEVTKEGTRRDFRKHAYYAGGILLASMLGLLALYLLMRSRMNRSAATINEIKNGQKRNLEELLKLDNKLISIIEKENIETTVDSDHSLALKVADEVVRIEMNLFRMDKSVKGYKQLSKAIERIKNNFTAQGYEIVDMLGIPYNEGMRINADFLIDETLPEGSRIITSITKPQINYKGKMIQKAIVTISQNI